MVQRSLPRNSVVVVGNTYALIRIKNEVDQTLTFRDHAERESALRDAHRRANTLTCTKSIDEIPGDVRIYPFRPHLEVVKDLVPDLIKFYANMLRSSYGPRRQVRHRRGEWRQSHQDR